MTPTKLCDSIYSWIIRFKGGWTCFICGYFESPPTRNIHNSHYWGREHKATRYLDDNCDPICYNCHLKHEHNKQGLYRDLKLKQLGVQQYNHLKALHQQYCKFGTPEQKELLAKLVQRAQKENIYQHLPERLVKDIGRVLNDKKRTNNDR